MVRGYGFSGTMNFYTQMMHIPCALRVPRHLCGVFGGLGLLVGLLSRVAAFGISVNMLVAIFTVLIHNGLFGNWTGQQKGEGFGYHRLGDCDVAGSDD